MDDPDVGPDVELDVESDVDPDDEPALAPLIEVTFVLCVMCGDWM